MGSMAHSAGGVEAAQTQVEVGMLFRCQRRTMSSVKSIVRERHGVKVEGGRREGKSFTGLTDVGIVYGHSPRQALGREV